MSERSVHLPKLVSEQFAVSTSEARRLIVQGGVKVDGRTPLSFDYSAEQLAGKTLTVGKRRSVKLPSADDVDGDDFPEQGAVR